MDFLRDQSGLAFNLNVNNGLTTKPKIFQHESATKGHCQPLMLYRWNQTLADEFRCCVEDANEGRSLSQFRLESVHLESLEAGSVNRYRQMDVRIREEIER